jgi:undecaprenyl-diphosphatase
MTAAPDGGARASLPFDAALLTIASSLITTFQAVVLGALQGISELFPISSLGHTVIFPNLFGWSNIVKWQSQTESPWLAFIVMLHVGSAVGLLAYFWREWVEIITAFFRTLGKRRIETRAEKLAWLIVVSSIPTGILGILLEHPARVATAKPEIASIFLVVNGIALFAAELLRRRSEVRVRARTQGRSGRPVDREIESLNYREAVGVGFVQSSALIAGISRDGVVMSAGLQRGLDNAGAAKFSFLLATPIILAAGLFKVGDLLGHDGNGIRGAAVIAAVVAAIVAVFTVHFLTRYFKTRNLIPFAIYCLIFGAAMIIYNA